MQKLRLIKGSGPERDRGPYLARKGKAKPPPLRLVLPGGGHRIIDLRRHRETYKGFKLEVWQTAESCGTARPCFYTLRYNLEAKTPAPRRDHSEFSELDAAIRHIRRRADRWRYLLDQRPQRPETKPRRKYRGIGIPRERELIAHVTAAPQAWEPRIHAYIEPDHDLPAAVRDAIADAQAS